MDSSIPNARRLLAQATHPVSFSGAGLSAESGIATFRGHDEGAMWSEFDPTQLASQQGFSADPELVITWYNSRRRTLHNAQPNAAHYILSKQIGWAHITQNVDNLLESGGSDPLTVLHLHGSLLQDHCNANCGYTEVIDLADPPGLRRCPQCGVYLRPSVVWFGEALSETVFLQATQLATKTDLLLVVGTSAQVYPAAGLIDVARQHGADIIVLDTEPIETSEKQTLHIQGNAAEVLPKLFDSQDR